MPFTLTLHLPRRRATPVDVEVEVDPGTGDGAGVARARDLRTQLADLLGEAVPALIGAGGPVDDDAEVGRPPLVHGASLVIGAGAATEGAGAVGARPGSAPLDVVVVSGPDCGLRRPVPPGGLVVGRDGGADLVVDDPDLSRAHARLCVTPAGVTLEDTGSTNGVYLDGRRIPPGACPVGPGSSIRLGSTTLRLRRPGQVRAPTTAAGSGLVTVHRSSRVRPPEVDTLVEEPAAPARHGARIPWVAAIAPLPVAGVMAAMLGPRYLLFAATGPLLLLGPALADRLGGRHSERAQRSAYEVCVHDRRRRLAAAVAEEARRLRHDHPDPAAILDIASGPGRRLWERSRDSPDRLVVRLGTGALPARTSWVPAGGDRRAEHPPLEDVPVTVDLAAVGALGVVGPPTAVLDAARGIVGQLAVLQSPADLRLWLAVDHDGADWSWCRWLPHAEPDATPDRLAARARPPLGEAADIVAAARATAPSRPDRWDLLVIDARDGRVVPTGLLGLVEYGLSVGVAVVVLASDAGHLPAGCAAVLQLAEGAGSRLRVDGVADLDGVVADRVRWWWSERLARVMAPLRDGRPDDSRALDPPDAVRLPDLLATDPFDPPTIRSGWAVPAEPVATLGATGTGPWRVRLRTDGPHLLVGGTTGSGKSELLQCLVASLAVTLPPEAVSFVLVDYKGGSAFAACAGLPHTVGLVTDLDDHLAARALASLQAELTRRERVLARVNARDLEDYLERRRPGDPPLGRLVIVIDEFRLLAEELPDFIAGMVRIAAVGRSLGVHLVLATQRPTGIVSAEIQANVNLRVALRVRDRADSLDVIDAPEAALIPAHRPGRGLARAGGGPLVAFQAARVSAPAPSPTPRGLRVRIAPRRGALLDTPGLDPPTRPMDPAPTDLDRVVEAVTAAQSGRAADAPHRPWLPPLPTTLRLADIELPSGSAPTAPVGLADLPDGQRQEPLSWGPDGGHWLLVGASRSGRTTAALTVALAAAGRWGPDQLQVYAVAAGGDLTVLERLPHTGTVAGLDEPDRVDRLIARLRDEVRARTGTRAAAAGPAMLLLVDGWERFAAPDVLDGGVGERLSELLRDGASAGLTAVVTGDRSLLLGRTSSLASETFVLRLADPVDAALVGLDRRALPPDPPPGRAVRARDGVEIQFALPILGAGDPATDQAPAHGAGGVRAPDRAPITVRRLPSLVTLDELEAAPPWTVGLGGDDARAVTLDPDTSGRLLLVSGARGAGRTTALAVIGGAALRAGRRVAVVAPTAGPLSTHLAHVATGGTGQVTVVTAYDVDDLVAARRAHPDLVVLVDDADALLDTPVEPLLSEIGRLVDRDHGLLVASTTPSGVLAQVRGVAVEAARRQRGLLLGRAGPAEAAVFGVPAPRGMPRRPGRGLLLAGGEPVPVQVAVPADWPSRT